MLGKVDKTMCCRIIEMKDKQVVCIKDGTILGFVCDVEVDTCTGKLCSIVVFGRRRCFGLLGREEDCIIPWENIEVIGQDSILVSFEPPRPRRRKRRGGLSGLFSSRETQY